MSWIRQRVGAYLPRKLPMGEALGAQISPRAPRAVLDSRAAVAAILRPSAAGPEVLLIKRAERAEDPWSGHMAFPGGREETEDDSLWHTAVRETHEEIGWALKGQASFLGRLDDLPAVARGRPTGLLIAPFVFEVQEELPLSPNEEVAEVVWAPLAPMMRGEWAAHMDYMMGETSLRLPAHDVGGRLVWGLTYGMLDRLFSLLSDG